MTVQLKSKLTSLVNRHEGDGNKLNCSLFSQYLNKMFLRQAPRIVISQSHTVLSTKNMSFCPQAHGLKSLTAN